MDYNTLYLEDVNLMMSYNPIQHATHGTSIHVGIRFVTVFSCNHRSLVVVSIFPHDHGVELSFSPTCIATRA